MEEITYLLTATGKVWMKRGEGSSTILLSYPEPITSIFTSTSSSFFSAVGGSRNLYLSLPSSQAIVHTFPSAVIKVTCGLRHVIVLTADGDVWGRGEGRSGQLGTGNTYYQPSFILLAKNIKDIACSLHSTYLLGQDGVLRVTGDNSEGQLGLGSYLTSLSFVIAPKLPSCKEVKAGGESVVVTDKRGKVWSAGSFSSSSTFLKVRIKRVEEVGRDNRVRVFTTEGKKDWIEEGDWADRRIFPCCC